MKEPAESLSTPQGGRWIARPRKPRPLVPVFVGLMLLSQSPNWLNVLTNAHGSHRWVAVLIVALVLGGLSCLLVPLVRDLLARRKTVRDAALVDGAFGQQFPVEVTVASNGQRIGTDRGVAWFAEGLVGFSGEAFSFVLAASDLAPQWIEGRREHPKGSIPPNALGLRGAPGRSYLHFAPLLGHGKGFWDRLREFVNADEPATGERFWPPLEPYAEPMGAQAEACAPETRPERTNVALQSAALSQLEEDAERNASVNG